MERLGDVGIAVRVAGAQQAQKSLAQLQKSIGDLNKTPLNILTGIGAGSSARQDQFRTLSQGAKDFFNAVASGTKSLASTTAGLRQQAAAFRDLADNINFTDQSQKRFFRNFTQGAEIARTKSAGAGIEQLRALQDLYQRGTTGLKQDINPKTGGLNQLLSLGKDLPRTKAALSEYRSELERVYDLVETRSPSGGIIAVELRNVEKELLKIEQDRIEANNQINGIAKASYALTRNQLFLEEENLATIERQVDARRKAQQAANDLYSRSKALSRDFGVDPTRALRPAGVSDEQVALRNLISTQSRLNAIEEENLAAVERRIGARQQELAVANELVKAQRQQAVDIYNRDRALSREFGVNPAMALRPAGVSDEQVAKRNLIVDRTTAAAEASVFNVVSKVAQEIENDLPVLKSIERHRRKTEAASEREALSEAKNANQASARSRSAELRRTGGLSFDERLARIRPDLAPGAAKPAPGFFRGDARKAIGEGLIGGAFPLLFGQGAGASVGGLAGGLAGGAIGGSFGFGLSLAGTAVGTAVDTTAQNLKDLAASLKSPNDAIAALETSGFRVSNSLKFQVEQLQAVGRGYDAQTLVLQEVQRRLGPGSITELRELDVAQKRLQESWAAIGAEIQTRLLPVLQGFVEFLGGAAGDIGGFASQSRLERLDPETFGRLRDQAIKETSGPLGMFGDKKAYDARLNELARQELSGRFQNERAQVPRSPQEAFADETTRIQESRRIADQIQSAYREAFQLQRQAHDMQREGADINREIADYSYRKQREIFDLRQQVAEKEIENNRAAAQNSIERGDLGARQTFAAAVGFEQQLLSNVREVVRSRKEGEADIEQSRRKLELTMSRLSRDVEDYKRTNAREIEDIERRKLSYVRSVEDYKMRVADYVRDRARESADLMQQAMAQGEVGGAGGMGGQVAGYAPVSPLRRISYLSEIDRAAKEANIDPRLFAGLVQQESAFNPNARSGSGAIGLAQLMPGTARELGVDPFNIQENLRGGARYLRQMMDRFGLEGGLRAYNQGPGAQQRTPGGNSRESREYPGKVLANARALGFNPAAMPAPATMGGAAFGRTGHMSLREGYGMVDLRGSSREAIIADAADAIVNRAAMGMKTWIGGGGGLDIDATNLRGQALIAALQQGMRAHETRGRNPATAIDLIAKLGEPLGIAVGGISNRGGATGVAGTTARGTIALHLTPESVGRGATSMQASAATTISSAPRPQFNPVPTGPTPAAAPLNAAREMLDLAQGRGLQDAQRILEEQNRLKQDGIELGQIEQILQSTQLPQLKQQGDALRKQIEARQQNLALSDEAAAVADIQAEGEARLAQLLEDRRNALQKVQTQYSGDVERIKQVNRQAAEAIAIAKGEEEQRIKNVKLSNQGQNLDRGWAEILQLQEGLALAKVEAAALERGELEASNVELFKASALYERLTEQQKQMAEGLVAQTEELRKQSEFRKQMNELQQDTSLVGAGLRAGMIGAPARAFEEGLKRFDGDVGKATEFANQTKLFENQQLVWQNLEKNIVDVSDAISGALTNGLLDIVSGARQIEDVGRDMLNGIARTFADSAQQQLTTLMQRQLAQLAGPRLAGMLGAGTGAAGPQALGMASLTAAGQVAMFGATLQTVMAQMALSGAASGLGSTPSLLGTALPSFVPGLSPTIFGGFLANGGTTRPGEAYVVGDGGEPEFFFPGVTGRVVPKSDMEKAAALREASGEEQGPIDVRYTVTEQAGQRYVTEEQFRRGMADTAKRAQAMTKAGLRNNKDDREYVGI